LKAILPGAAALFLTAACASVYVGESQDPQLSSEISGDFKLRFTSPVNVYLRKVDETELGVFASSAHVAPGDHQLLVDCKLEESGSLSRFDLTVTTVAGSNYRLRAKLADGNQSCSGVELVETQN